MSTKGFKILVAEDEPDLAEIVQYHLEKEGYDVQVAKDGSEAVTMAQQWMPQLVILDMMMPKKSGAEVCEFLRAKSVFKDTVIMFLTALNDEATHIKSLELGADDFVSKPVSMKILLSKVASLLRRISSENASVLHIDNVNIDPIKYLVQVNKEEKILAKKEFELLYLLAQKPGKVFLRNEILSAVWGNDVIVGDRTIDVHIRKIRSKLNLDCITTVKGVGYKFEL